MSWLGEQWRRMRMLWRRRQHDQELAAEMALHIELRAQRLRERGLPAEEARAIATRRFGNALLQRELSRDAWGWPRLEAWWQDARYAARSLRRSPAFSAAAILTLALGIGATTAIFTVVDALLLRPLPFPEADRLVRLLRVFPDFSQPTTSVPKFIYWRDHGQRVFADVAAYDPPSGSGFNLGGSDRPERVTGSRVSAGFFDVMDVQPALGRAFRQAEDVPGGPKLVILSHALWTNRFGARPAVIGQAITLNSEPYTVIGVMPDGFRFPDIAELWTLFQFDPADQSRSNYFEVLARLKPETTLDQAGATMELAGSRLRDTTPDLMGDNETVGVRPLREALYGDMRPALLVLLASVGFVLLIACVNVANLQLAQAAERHHEIALRTALGASTWTVARQLLLESVLLAVIGGVAGVALAYVGTPALLALNPVRVPYTEAIAVDWRVLGFAFVISLGAGLAFGLLPAWQSARPNLDEVLRSGTHRTVGGTSHWTRWALVAGEVALALMLTIGAFLLVKSLAGLQSTSPGFRVERVLTMKLSLPDGRYGTGKALAQFQERVEQELSALPGVRAAALAGALPLGPGPDMPFTIEGRYVPGTDTGVGDALYRMSGAGYFDALQIPLKRGRLFDARDRQGTLPVAIVNEAAVRQISSGEDPIGERITVGQPFVPEFADPTPREIVGVVGDTREVGLGVDPLPILYVPLSQQNDALASLLVRILPVSIIVRGEASVAALTRSVEQATCLWIHSSRSTTCASCARSWPAPWVLRASTRCCSADSPHSRSCSQPWVSTV